VNQTSFFNTISHRPNLSQSENHLTVGASSLSGDWDPAITDYYNIISQYYSSNSLESIVWQPENSFDYQPNLATSWEFEYWLEENNSLGFTNTGGHKSVTLTLRQGVTFHDGSDWNATVLKWNIDQAHLINGNYTGAAEGDDDWEQEEGNLLGTMLVEDYKPYFTPNWNLSEYDSPNLGITEPTTPPTVTDYAWYDLGPNASLIDYPGLTLLPNNTVMNPTPYGGWVSGSPIHYAPYDRFPIVKYVEIIENLASGGKVKVHFNSWNSEGFNGFVNNPIISYHSYKDDYTVHGIYGWKDDELTSPNPTMVKNLIGTGPYIYIEHDEVGTPPGGSMVKNLNYWNRTALEAEGWFDADYIDIISFPAGELGKDAQNTALLTHAIDYSFDSMFRPLDYNAIQANPRIQYLDAAASEYKTNIVLNCINETWWAWPEKDAWRIDEYGELSGNVTAGGVPHAMRKAMSFAYNYDLHIHTVLNDRAVRNGGTLGTANLYYNDSVGIADYNVTKAREILLTTETDTSGDVFNTYNEINQSYLPDNDLYNFSKLCDARGLTASSPDGDWVWAAENNPIYTFNFYYDSAHQDTYNILVTSLKDIGVAVVSDADNKVNTIIWDTVRFGTLRTFDGEHGLFSCNGWVMDEHMPHDVPALNTFWHYVDPDRGRWRETGDTPGTSQAEHYWGNFGFNFVSEIDLIYDRLATSGQAERKQYYSQIADIQQNEKYGVIFLYEAKEGWALWKDWEMNLNHGFLFFANFDKLPAPGDIALSSDAGIPDIDGNFNLIWNVSIGADNYSLYRYDSVITQINGSLDLIADKNATSPFSISGLTDGEYYFVVVAHNQSGDTMSNNFHITVQIPPPGVLTLSSNAGIPDIDGNFDLTWSTSIGADNYSLYRHDSVITQINGSLDFISYQTATSPFPISGLTDGEYYFVVVASNQSGDAISNNIHITVQIPPPGALTLSSDMGTPDIDGNFNLTWSASIGADNYSIYRYDSAITQINGSLVLISYQTATSPFPISGLTDGMYYFVVVAHNPSGDTLSNNIQTIVQIPPRSFILSTNALFPDDDGIFNLIWTISDGADNYSLYMHNNPITVINSSLILLFDQIITYLFPVSGLSNGEYYFMVLAHNQNGDTFSNMVHVTVSKTEGPNAPAIPGYNIFMILGIVIFSAVILFKRKKIKCKLR